MSSIEPRYTVVDHNHDAHPIGLIGWCVIDATTGRVTIDHYTNPRGYLAFNNLADAERAARARNTLAVLTEVQHAYIAHAVREWSHDFLKVRGGRNYRRSVDAPVMATRVLEEVIDEVGITTVVAAINARLDLDPDVLGHDLETQVELLKGRTEDARKCRDLAEQAARDGSPDEVRLWLEAADRYAPEGAARHERMRRNLLP